MTETDKTVTAQDLAAARDVLWPGRTEAALASWPLSDDERQLEVRVAVALADLSADAEDAWRHAREAEADLALARQQLLDTASVASAAVDTATLSNGVRMALRMLHEEASAAVSRQLTMAYAVGLAEGEKRAQLGHADEALDPEAVRAVELEDDQGQRGTLIGPADKIAAVVRPEAVVREDG